MGYSPKHVTLDDVYASVSGSREERKIVNKNASFTVRRASKLTVKVNYNTHILLNIAV